ncbi:hypothetical protein D3C73_1389320 [compost metagenome]
MQEAEQVTYSLLYGIPFGFISVVIFHTFADRVVRLLAFLNALKLDGREDHFALGIHASDRGVGIVLNESHQGFKSIPERFRLDAVLPLS